MGTCHDEILIRFRRKSYLSQQIVLSRPHGILSRDADTVHVPSEMRSEFRVHMVFSPDQIVLHRHTHWVLSSLAKQKGQRVQTQSHAISYPMSAVCGSLVVNIHLIIVQKIPILWVLTFGVPSEVN